jgi:hypothetical protein
MKRAFFAVVGAALLASAAAAAAQTTQQRPAQPPRPVINYLTFTGCVDKASSGAYVLNEATDAKEGAAAAKKNFMLTGVVPGLKLADHMKKRVEVVGSIGEPTSANPNTPTLIMESVKQVGSC